MVELTEVVPSRVKALFGLQNLIRIISFNGCTCIDMLGMETTTLSLNDEAYNVLKAQKKEGESFSELILRKFGKGSPAAIKAVVMKFGLDSESADA